MQVAIALRSWFRYGANFGKYLLLIVLHGPLLTLQLLAVMVFQRSLFTLRMKIGREKAVQLGFPLEKVILQVHFEFFLQMEIVLL